MTKIEKIKTETYVAYSHPEVNDKINELVEVTNGMQDILAEYKTMIQEAKQMSLKADLSINYLGEQIKALQKKLVDFDHVTDSGKKVEKAFTHDSVEQPAEVEEDTPLFQEEHKFKKIDNNRCLSCGAKDKSDCCGFGGLHSTVTKEDLLVPDEIEFMKRGTEFCLLLEKGGLKWLSYNDHWGWTVDGRTRDNIEGHIVKCRLVPCKLEDVEVGEWVYANYELCLDEQDKYYLCIGDKLFCYIDEGVKEIVWGAMTNNLNVHYLYKVQPIEWFYNLS